MKQKFIIMGTCLVLFAFSASSLLIKNTSAKSVVDLPQQDGLYDVPGNSKLKLRVIVHRAKPRKPTPTPTRVPTSTPIPTATPTTTPPQTICTIDNNTSNLITIFTGWHLKSGNIIYNLNKNSVPASVGANNLSAITTNSFHAWSNTNVGSKVTFTEGSPVYSNKATLDSKNIIAWGNTSASALAITYTWYYPSTGEVAESDTIFNNNYSWAWSGGSNTCAVSGYYDAQDILTHELGHWMGLGDNYDTTFADHTMYGYGSLNEVYKNTLTQGDTTSVNSLY